MGDLKLPPSGRLPSLSQGVPSTPAARPVQAPAQNQPQVSPAAPAAAKDQVVSRALQGGQAAGAVAFVETEPPGKEEIQWAKDLDTRVRIGYRPTVAETQKYN